MVGPRAVPVQVGPEDKEVLMAAFLEGAVRRVALAHLERPVRQVHPDQMATKER